MASGQAFKLPKAKPDGTIERETLFVNAEGQVDRMTEIIFSAEEPALSESFGDEILALVESGEISVSLSDQHIVNISDQLEAGKYTYIFVDKDGNSKKASAVYRIFLNGINVTDDVDIAEDYLSFTFIDDYNSDDFGYPHTKLIIDFTEDSDV